MTAGTHFALPIIAASTLDFYCVATNGQPRFSGSQLLLIGAFGLLPDLLSPHLSLRARYSSISHTAWFLLGCLVVAVVLAIALPTFRMTIGFCWFAVVLHVACDLISGGVRLFPPYDRPVGKYWVPPRYWLPLDVAALGVASLLYWVLRR